MLSYQHEYHAGNHADVLKHAALTLVIRALQRKPTPIRVLDSHAGAGVYDLGSREARRNAEHEGGIARVLAAPDPPPALADYLDAVRACNPGSSLRRYPGSPWIARHLLRPVDHLELMELHPRAVSALRRTLGGDAHVHVHGRDAFEGLPALVPPPERRGVALIDPSYEVKEEFGRVVDLLAACHRRWPAGVYVAWYPLLRERAAERFVPKVAALGIRRIYRAELAVEGTGYDGLRGSGVLVVNLPFGLEASFGSALAWAWDVLSAQRRGAWQAGWLVPE
jgi:23S rRNA (adenine2030-N6)-methyltransferase